MMAAAAWSGYTAQSLDMTVSLCPMCGMAFWLPAEKSEHMHCCVRAHQVQAQSESPMLASQVGCIGADGPRMEYAPPMAARHKMLLHERDRIDVENQDQAPAKRQCARYTPPPDFVLHRQYFESSLLRCAGEAVGGQVISPTCMPLFF